MHFARTHTLDLERSKDKSSLGQRSVSSSTNSPIRMDVLLPKQSSHKLVHSFAINFHPSLPTFSPLASFLAYSLVKSPFLTNSL